MKVVTWNIGCGQFEGRHSTSLKEAADYVGACLKSAKADLVALQEVVYPNDDQPDGFLKAIAARADLSHFAYAVHSPSHLVENADIGVAILSRWPITDSSAQLFPTPDLPVLDPAMSSARLHKKGLIKATIDTGHDLFGCLCGHLPPFRLLPEGPESDCFAELWSDLDDAILESGSKCLVLMDFNTEAPLRHLPRSAAAGLTQSVHRPTRPSGDLHDHILLWPGWDEALIGIEPSRFDHHMVAATLKPQESKATRRPGIRRSFPAATILHLSDLHLGPGTAEDVDWKTYVRPATRETRRDRLKQYLLTLPAPPSFVVVSGDVTIAGGEAGLRELPDLLDELIAAGSLPPRERILIVPGNHDVTRVEAGTPATAHRRWQSFARHLSAFTLPLLSPEAGLRERIVARVREQLAGSDRLLGGVFEGAVESGDGFGLSAPFLLDRDLGLLIYGFNSACVSGSQVAIPPEVEAALLRAKESAGDGSDLSLIVAEFEKQLWIDPARIDPSEFELFSNLMDMIGSSTADFDQYVKIAVLHHHVSPAVPEEFTKFDGVSNAGRLKCELVEAGFEIILHGHKHWPGVEVELGAERDHSLVIVSGGTVGGGVGGGEGPGFFWLGVPSDHKSLQTSYVPVKRMGNAGAALAESLTRVSHFPLRLTRPMLSSLQTLDLEPILSASESSLLAHQRNLMTGGRMLKGWSHALEEDRVSILATAYGVICLDLLSSGRASSREAIRAGLETLLFFKNEDGGWSGSSQGNISRPEPTAFVIDALAVDPTLDLSEPIACLEAMVEDDPTFWTSTFAVSRVARTLARWNPASDLLKRCIAALSAGAIRDRQGRINCWSQALPSPRYERAGSQSEGSVLHSAHAVLTFASARAAATAEDLSSVPSWLLQRDWANCSEGLNRLRPDGRWDALILRHFTAPWVVMAALELGVDHREPRMRDEVLRLVGSQQEGLWDWGATTRPIWATHDAARALIRYAHATT